MSFASDMKKFQSKLEFNEAAQFNGSVQLALRSIQYGSDLTGSPGQPKQSGDLINSWFLLPEGARRVLIYTNSPYAESNEDGIARPGGGKYRLLSSVGGRWSVRKTRIGFQRIVDYVATTTEKGRS